MNDDEYLIQALLAEFKDDDSEIQNYDELVIQEDSKAEDVNDDQEDDVVGHPETSYDWDNLSDDFPVSKFFSNKANNIPFETIRSGAKYVKMG
ncbi:hypothetical protein HPULCUR_001675 [Helicostylum pulchrum]|uniref:Uncharacterized protein n=1 Tax=Helicostylum pulchrum TaxID=562976 RepID=A0ABP9XNC7_9FUNG